MLQAMLFFMVLTTQYIVIFQRKLKVRKWLSVFAALFTAVGVIFASLDVWGAYKCNEKVAYSCTNDHLAPGYVGYFGGTVIRLSLIILSLGISIHVVADLWKATTRDSSMRSVVLRELAKKMLLYPIVQCLSRLPDIVILKYEGFYYADKPDDPYYHTKLAGVYLMAICGPMGGVLMLLVFIYLNKEVRSHNSHLFARLFSPCKNGIVWKQGPDPEPEPEPEPEPQEQKQQQQDVEQRGPDQMFLQAQARAQSKNADHQQLVSQLDEEQLMYCVSLPQQEIVQMVENPLLIELPGRRTLS